MHRNDYNNKINALLRPYKITFDGTKSKMITGEIFELLESVDDKTKKERVELAIERAERNYNQFDHKNPAKEESSTTVFKLVKKMLEYL